MTRRSAALAAALISILHPCGLSLGDEPRPGAGPHESLAALRADHARRARDLDRQRIKDLAALASSKSGDESDEAYEELFGLAIARDLYGEAEPAALKRLADASAPFQARALAVLVSIIAKADRGDYDQSFDTLAGFLKAGAAEAADPDRPKIEASTAIALGEAYLQRLFAARKYDLARKVGALVKGNVPRPEIQAHFAARMARLDLIGRPAPALAGVDVDGKPLRLADFKGKVVLVDFWAAWCPPCIESIPDLAAANARFGKDGFAILGVNLDAQRAEVGSVEKARPIVRRLLVSAGVGWPSIMADAGPSDPTKPYGVTDIPANFLIGRDGTIVGFELHGEALAKAVEEELKK